MTTTSTDFRWLVVPEAEAQEPDRELVGGKAWSLWRMSSLGLRVPPSFVVTTRACSAFFEGGQTLPDGLEDEIRRGVRLLETTLGRTFGGAERPLLVSVRSGAAISMPGMMDTILNLGMNADTERALAQESGSPEFAADVHRRFTAFYGRLVLGCSEEVEELDSVGAVQDAVRADCGEAVPSDAWKQLTAAVASVFASSRSRRAIAYRDHQGIAQDLGTAVTIQAMVFGNLDEASGTGVLFSRNPLSGERSVYGEYLPCGQGEDVVSGRVTPRPLEHLAEHAPAVHAELLAAAERLEADGRDAQDIEFTVQEGVLFLLQSRAAKRTARAAVRIAVDLAREGVITRAEATRRVTAAQVRALLRPTLADGADDAATLLASGVGASPGVVTGLAVATPEEAQEHPGSVLVRKTTSPEDVHGMIAAVAIVTEHGGSTSHAAVVSRALDTPCVVGCGEGSLDGLLGRVVTVDAVAGHVYDGALRLTVLSEDGDPDLRELTEWARDQSPLRVVDRAHGPVFDADEDAATAEGVCVVPPGTTTVAGAFFSTDAGVAAALEAGVRAVVADQALPVLLAAIAQDAS